MWEMRNVYDSGLQACLQFLNEWKKESLANLHNFEISCRKRQSNCSLKLERYSWQCYRSLDKTRIHRCSENIRWRMDGGISGRWLQSIDRGTFCRCVTHWSVMPKWKMNMLEAECFNFTVVLLNLNLSKWQNDRKRTQAFKIYDNIAEVKLACAKNLWRLDPGQRSHWYFSLVCLNHLEQNHGTALERFAHTILIPIKHKTILQSWTRCLQYSA